MLAEKLKSEPLEIIYQNIKKITVSHQLNYNYFRHKLIYV